MKKIASWMMNKISEYVSKREDAQVAGLSLIPGIAAALVVGFVFVSIGADVMQSINDQQTANTAAANSTQAGLNALIQFSNFGATMGLIAAATVVLTLLAVGLGALVFTRR